MDCFLVNRNHPWNWNNLSINKMKLELFDIAGHVINFLIWIYIFIIVIQIDNVTFLETTFPLLGIIGAIIFNIIKEIIRMKNG